MSQSTDAIFAFGFDLGEELPDCLQVAGILSKDEDACWEWENVIASLAGIGPPPGEYDDETKPEWRAYWDRLKVAEDAHPLTIIEHCSGDCPMYFLVVNGTEQRAYRGGPKAVDVNPIDPTSIEAMRSFCEFFGIEWQDPKWHIFSMWN